MIGGLKECGNFAGEKKGTFFLVICFWMRSWIYG